MSEPKVFKCHKEVMATPMNRRDYSNYRNWPLPVDENGEDEGYLVEYLDGGQPNHPDHKGYISWSPKEVFEKGYTEMVKQDKVSYDHIKSLIDSLEFTFVHVPNTTITGCWAKLPNGFNIGYGESACVDPANFREDLGQQYARERALANATEELWKVEGYLLKVTGLTSEKF